MQDAFGIVLFVVVGIGVVVAIASLFGRGKLYDDIGRGGLSIGEDRDLRPNPPEVAPISRADREDEIRQMLEARNALRAARGEDTFDVEEELRELTRGGRGGRDPLSSDPEIIEEVRTL